MRFLDSVYTPLLAALLTSLCSIAHANPTQLSANQAGETGVFFAMAANGTRIVFRNAASPETLIINQDATNESILLTDGALGTDDVAVLGDNGDTVFFSSTADLLNQNLGNPRSIFAIANDASTLNKISPSNVNTFEFDVVATTNKVVFTSTTNFSGTNPGGSLQVFSVAADGSNFTRVSDLPAGTDVSNLHISADGETIVFSSTTELAGPNPDGSPEVYLLDVDQAGITRITDESGQGSVPVGIASNGLNVPTTVAFVSSVDHTGENPDNELQFFVSDTSDIRQISGFTVYPGPGTTPDDPASALADLDPRLSRFGDRLFFTATNFDDKGEKTQELSSVSRQDIYYFDFEAATLNRAIANARLLDVSTGASGVSDGGFSGAGTGLTHIAFNSSEDFDPDGIKGGNVDGSDEIFYFSTANLADAPGAVTGLGPGVEYPYSDCPECLVGEESGGGSASALLLLIFTLCGYLRLWRANAGGRAQRFTENRRS